MKTIIKIIKILAAIFGSIAAVLAIFILIPFQWPAPMPWIIKLYASALTPIFLLIGLGGAIAGWRLRSYYIGMVGIFVFIVFSIHYFGITRPPEAASGFGKAFGTSWEKGLSSEQSKFFLSSRSVFTLPTVPKPRFDQNIPFYKIPASGRELLCDIWQPNEKSTPSGLAMIYLHGSAWYFLDKDLGTRPLFSHLAAQGHVIMDVAYRFSPEADMMGMVNDVKRAIVWMRENAATYGVNPNQIVVCGGSSGGHLALLAAYTSDKPEFTPEDLEGKDVSASAVISMYGPTDLETMYYHTNQHLTTRLVSGKPRKTAPTKMPDWMVREMGEDYHRLGFDKGLADAGSFAPHLGCHPDECPETYAYYSPISHVHSKCPPTLLIHGKHDLMAPVKTTQALYNRLVENKVQVVMHLLPQTDHAFDLFMTNVSPSAHNAFYDVERFLGLIVSHPSFKESVLGFSTN